MSSSIRPRQYYEDIYDRTTINLCRDEEEILRGIYKRGLDEKVSKLTGKKKQDALETLNRVINFFHHFNVELLAGERWENREARVKELMDEAESDAGQIEQARLTREPVCKHCGKTGLRIISKDLMYRGPDYDEQLVIFMLECPHCKKRSAVWEDNRPYESRKTYCKKCKTEMDKKSGRRGEVITDTFTCPKCGFTFKEKLDLRTTVEKPDKYWEIDKARFLFDEKRGREYIEEKQHLASMGDIKALLDDFKEHEENKEVYDAVAAIAKVNIGQLKETLQPDIEKAGYTELQFEKPEMGREVVIGFSCLDGKADRAEYDSRNTLKKVIEKRLKGTNWRLMSDGIFYRLGYLTGRLRAYEGEEGLKKLVDREAKSQ